MLKNIRFYKLLLEKNRTFQDGYDDDYDDDDLFPELRKDAQKYPIASTDYNYDDDDYSTKYDDDDYDYRTYQDDNDDVTEEDEHQSLESMIRTFLSARQIKSYVEYKNGEVIIYIFLNKKEKISNLTKIFDVVLNHLSKDIFGIEDEESLSDIDTELYETKEGDHIFSFRFDLDSDDEGGKTRKQDYDDLPF
jgi:hypothetical protein